MPDNNQQKNQGGQKGKQGQGQPTDDRNRTMGDRERSGQQDQPRQGRGSENREDMADDMSRRGGQS